MSRKPTRKVKGKSALEAFVRWSSEDPDQGSDFLKDWAAFNQAHNSWSAAHVGDDPVYALPSQVIDELCRHKPAAGQGRSSPSLLTSDEEQAERELRALCKGDCVGVWQGQPIDYPLLGDWAETAAWLRKAPEQYERHKATRKKGPVPPETLRKARLAGQTASARMGELNCQRLGYAGWLILNDQFRTKRDALIKQWRACGALLLSWLPPNAPSQEPRARRARLIKDLERFRRRWQLVGLPTWDLPDPQGPVVLLPAQVPRLAASQVIVGLPTYFDMGSSSRFHDDVVAQQRDLARQLGISYEHPLPDIAPRRVGKSQDLQPSSFATAFRVTFIERTARSRYGKRRGLITRLCAGLLAHLKVLGHEVKADRLMQIRKQFCRALY